MSTDPPAAAPSVASRFARFEAWASRHWAYLLAFVLWTVWVASWEPITRTESHYYRLGLAGFTLGWVWALWALRRLADRPWAATAHKLWRLSAAMAVVFGLFNYYNHDRDWFAGFDDYTDAAYYYLNSKYFDELGYTRLYEAVLVADLDGPRAFAPQIPRARDLDTYELVPRQVLLDDGPDVKSFFTPDRWAAFSHDANWFMGHKLDIPGGLDNLRSNFFVDHGYNPPPAWTLVGGTLANLVSVEHLKWLTSLDLVLVLMLFAGVYLAFGPDVALIVMLWWFCTFSGRWPVMTHSYLRFDWVVAFGLSMCALKLRREGLAGGLLAWATMTRLFPFIFAVPVVAVMGWQAVRDRAIAPSTRRFAVGAVGTLAVVSALAWVDVGTEGYRASAHKLAMHNSDPQAYSSQKVGLGDALFFRGETSRQEMKDAPCGGLEAWLGSECTTHGGIYGKADLIDLARPYLRVAGLSSLILVVAWAIRTRRPLHELPALGIVPLYCLTNPSYYYFTLRVALVLWHAQDLDKIRNRVGLSLLLLLELVSQYTVARVVIYDGLGQWPRYTTTGTISVGLGLYFAVIGALGAWEARRPGEEAVPAPRG